MDNINETRSDLLLDMLTFKRPHGSESEAAFIAKFIEPLEFNPNVQDYFKDDVGNIYIKTQGETKTLFTGHTDTMHSTSGMQEVWMDVEGTAFIDFKGEVLGADDGAGVFLLIEMIKAGVPAWFQFTAGEERGGIGSRFASEQRPNWLKQFDYAIAFDRKATHSIITHQFNGRCCSDEFGLAFGELLGMNHVLDTTGSFTDTANYTHLIPECTNVSVGYQHEHGPQETLDVHYVLALAEKLCSIDWANAGLPVKRDPADEGFLDTFGSYGKRYAKWDEGDLGDVPGFDDLCSVTEDEMYEWVMNSPTESVVWTIQNLLQDMIELKQELRGLESMSQGSFAGYDYI